MGHAVGPSVSNVQVDSSEEGLGPARSVEAEKEELACVATVPRARELRVKPGGFQTRRLSAAYFPAVSLTA